MLLEIERGRDRALPLPRAIDERRQRAVAVRADDDADVLGPVEKLRTEPLRHAARDSDDGPRLHAALELTEAAEHALLGVLANGAGVHQDHVRAIRDVHRLITVRCERAEHQLGIAHVHLAAVGFDVDGRARIGSHFIRRLVRLSQRRGATTRSRRTPKGAAATVTVVSRQLSAANRQ